MSKSENMEVITAKEFKPKVRGESDFYSWQLFRWLSRNKHYYRIYRTYWCSLLGKKVDEPILYIGLRDGGWLHGANLRHICHYGQSLKAWAYGSPEMEIEGWEDITDEFYTLYRSIGVCAIHGDSWHDWVTEGDKRTCSRCGASETKSIKMVPIEVWDKCA